MSAPSIPQRPAGRRGSAPQALEVVRSERISEHLVRVHLGGDGFEAWVAEADPERLAKTDTYAKLLFAKPELGLEQPYDLTVLRETLAPEDLPVMRTYTIRSIDTAARTLAIEFVVHGDEGVAGPWAANAQPGDLLTLSGPGGQYAPASGDTFHLLLGDESAIPAIAAAVEALEPSARGSVIVEVGGPADEIALPVPEGVELRWLHRADAAYGAPLVDAVRSLTRPEGEIDVFAHGERGAMKALRGILHGEWGIDRRSLSLSAYWALGRTEDRFQAEKREPVGQIFED
ncbi:siderophore-interacting protein [Microbacterium sp. NPDC055903]